MKDFVVSNTRLEIARITHFPRGNLGLLESRFTMAEERVKKAAEKLVELYWEDEKEMFLVHAEGCYNEMELRQDLLEDTERCLYHLIVILAAGDSDRIEHIIAELWHERNARYGSLLLEGTSVESDPTSSIQQVPTKHNNLPLSEKDD